MFSGPPPVVGAEALRSLERREHTSDFEEAVVREAVTQNVVSSGEGLWWIAAIDYLNQTLNKEREERREQHDRRMDRLYNLLNGLEEEGDGDMSDQGDD